MLGIVNQEMFLFDKIVSSVELYYVSECRILIQIIILGGICPTMTIFQKTWAYWPVDVFSGPARYVEIQSINF